MLSKDQVAQVHDAVARLRAGGLVAFPTETVYGLGADATDAAAVARVFSLKGRPANNPLIVHVDGVAMARRSVGAWPEAAEVLARAFWPGPLSIVLPRGGGIPAIVAGGGDAIAVRCPDHPLTLALIAAFGKPLVGPSANPSGGVSPTRAEHVRASFLERDVLVLDGGPCQGGIESTVVSLMGERPRVLRPGLISAAAIEAALDEHLVGPGGYVGAHGTIATDGPLESPGLLARHYAPRTPAVLVDAGDVARALREVRGRAIVLTHGNVRVDPPHGVRRMPASARAYAAELYAALREADDAGVDRILIVKPIVASATDGLTAAQRDESSLWAAIVDRLVRATAPG